MAEQESNAMEEDHPFEIDESLDEGESMEIEPEKIHSLNHPKQLFQKASASKASSSKASKTKFASTFDPSSLNEGTVRKFCKDVSRSFFKEYGLIHHQINSYNEFVENGIQKLFDSLGEIEVEPGFDPSKKGQGGWRHATIKFGKVSLEKPMFDCGKPVGVGGDTRLKLLPRHARVQRMTYSARMKVEMKLQVYIPKLTKSDKFKTGKEEYIDKEVISEDDREVVVGRIPVMVGSNLCWMSESEKGDCEFDKGGYFVIKGAEKTFIAQEQICLNRLWVFDTPNWSIQYRSNYKRKRVTVKLVELSDKEYLQGQTLQKFLNVEFLYISVPVWLLFFALGAAHDKEVVDMIDIDTSDVRLVNIILATIKEADQKWEGFRRDGKALKIIDDEMRKSKFPPKESMEECLDKYLFPSLSTPKQKLFYLGYIVKCLLLSFTGKRKCENRDDFRNKRLYLCGELFEKELRRHIGHVGRQMAKSIQRHLDRDHAVHPIEHYLDASIITNGVSRAFSTGHWAHPYKLSERVPGVVANLRRTNPLQTLADMRKTRQQVGYTGKVGDARFPHPSHWGRVCFLSTSDGENCGLVKNLSVTGLVTTDLIEPVLENLINCGMEKLADDPSPVSLKGKDKVFLNGVWTGLCKDSKSFVMALKHERRAKGLHPQVEIIRDQQQGEVRIFSDAGRIVRPLLVVENLNKITMFKCGYKFPSLLDEGVIELVGVEEEEEILTAWKVEDLLTRDKDQPRIQYTHLELDASFLLGLSCGIIPLANHDHARRVLYQSEKHSQQAIGYSTTNPNIRVDTLTHQLYYPQKPLFQTMVSECLGQAEYDLGQHVHPMPEIFNGQTAIVAVNVHRGYNQEDSIVMNRASVERGLFRTEHIRSYKAEVENKELLQNRRLKMKDKVDFGKIQSKYGRVDSLDDDGFPFVGANLQREDIVIGRCSESGADHSIKLKHTEKGRVQKVVLSADDDGTNYAVVSLRQIRSPCVGDKFSSMHGQKGVVGLLESQENLSFTRQGIVPDIVINPHAFPTRQTPAQLLEAVLGKGISCGGMIRDATPFGRYATPFTPISPHDIMEQLHRVGFRRGGAEKMQNGCSGQMMINMIFMGPTFYQRLTHMAEDKVKFRSTGPVHPLTRQPVADRKRFGGIKFGEMERDCLIAHGAAANLHERLFTLSDFSQMHICSKCSNIANVIQRAVAGGGRLRGPYCRFCESSEHIVKVNVPYGAKLLCQELFSMGISVKFGTEQG